MELVNHGLFIIITAVVCAAEHEERELPYRHSFLNPYPRFSSHNDSIDPGEPLFLTPLLNNESISRQEVRDMARVTGPQFLGVESYSGYLTVDEAYDSNMFFWYFPAEQDPEHAPVLLWLQGGPGASSLIGLFMENGPLRVITQDKLQRTKYSWSRTHNLIYIDNPVGTGFSFTCHAEGYARNECDVGRNLHEAVIQLYKLFEWSNSSGFWIAGESYAGKYVPALAYHIHNSQSGHEGHDRIPLKGLAIGNGLSDPLHQLKYGDYLYQLGLIDENGLERFHCAEAAGRACIRQQDMDCAFEIFDSLILGDLPSGSLFKNLTGYQWYYNYLQAHDEDFVSKLGNFLQAGVTRRAIHVGNKPFHDMGKENQVKKFLKEDLMDSVAPWIEELLKYYTVCIYSGQLDIIVAYPLVRNYLKTLKFPGSDRYKTAPRKIWRVDGELAGYMKQAGNLVEILIRNAGHMAPLDQPKWVYEMINHLTHYTR
ncbi:venom serine carboxypeptidase-like [Drosophila novamexicana]|uniref:venom serine carboxypeptidase-like n=1 Tax=Drosophila novamexicana TaxID=47314 RepID=UPI0011E5C085|nr:venom serine carboxypeptidase-like [Drosophila novamexicana]